MSKVKSFVLSEWRHIVRAEVFFQDDHLMHLIGYTSSKEDCEDVFILVGESALDISFGAHDFPSIFFSNGRFRASI